MTIRQAEYVQHSRSRSAAGGAAAFDQGITLVRLAMGVAREQERRGEVDQTAKDGALPNPERQEQ
jgi:hypothetical protein